MPGIKMKRMLYQCYNRAGYYRVMSRANISGLILHPVYCAGLYLDRERRPGVVRSEMKLRALHDQRVGSV